LGKSCPIAEFGFNMAFLILGSLLLGNLRNIELYVAEKFAACILQGNYHLLVKDRFNSGVTKKNKKIS
jgi:hypothetical protein